jgi:hypothetical protein
MIRGRNRNRGWKRRAGSSKPVLIGANAREAEAPAQWHRSERASRKLEQFQLEELEATAAEDELAAKSAAARSRTSDRRKRPPRKPFAVICRASAS